MVVPLAIGTYSGKEELRYFNIVMLVPLVWAVHHILRTMPRGFAWLPAIIVLISSAAIASPAWHAAHRLAAPDPLQACLEAEGRTAGFGYYWAAKILIFKSDRHIHIIQIGSRGEPYRLNINERWFTQRADDGTTPRPDFVIPGDLDPQGLRDVYGAPSRIRTCGSEELWLYDHSLPLPH